jgi:eukaryotic-like serine/threonine-protein kinase
MDVLADRNLLFGLLALQNGMIDQSALIVAFSLWTRDKVRSLAEILLDQGAIDEDDRAALLIIAAKHLKRHGGDVGKSLGAVSTAKALRQGLAELADPDVDATLSHVSSSKPTATEGDSEATETYGAPPGDGRRFQILRPHAKGGLGEVFVALDDELHREVALKQILEHHADDPTSRTRFVLEAEITGGLEHPGIVPVYGLGSDGDGRPYYAMRFIRGDSLKEAIAAFHSDESLKKDPGKKSLALRKLLRRFVDVCNAIDYAHGRGVIHRDLKPANIIVGKHGETLVVDWGLAKVMGKSEPGSSDERALMPSSSSGSAETLPGSAIGTPAYMSPEQSLGDLERLGPRSDVYSLGATLYSLLTGRAPFEGTDLGTVLRNVQKGAFPPPCQVDPSIDKALEAVCLMAMATRPEDRYPSSRMLADDLERWAADEPVSACPDPWSVRLARGVRRHRTAAAASAALLMTAVVGLTIGNLLLGEANRRTDAQRRLAVAREQEASGLRDLATANFTKAEENYRLARNAVDRYLGLVTNQRLLNEPFMAPLRRELVGTAREFFQEFVDRRAGDPGAITDLARTHSNLARILVLVEGPKSAIPAFEQARAELDSLPLKRPDSLKDRQLLLDTLNQLGRYYNDVGRRDDAAASYDRAIDLGTHLVSEPEESYRTRVLLATALGDRGDFLAHLGRRDGAQADLKRAVDLAQKLVDERPNDVSALDVLARVQESSGLAAYAREDFRE